VQADILIVVGVGCIALALASFLNAFTHGNLPRLGLVMTTLGGGLVVYANYLRPGGYRFEELPSVFLRVVGQLIG
jgi:hypothetical protein